MRRLMIAIAAGLLLATGACGSSGGTGSERGSDSTGSAAQDESAQDQEIADAGVLTRADVPSGFVATKDDDDDEDDDEFDAVVKATPECAAFQSLANDADDAHTVAEAESPDFERRAAQVSSSTDVYDDAGYVSGQLAQLQQPGLAPCLQAVFSVAFDQASAKPDATEGERALADATVVVTPLTTSFGDGSFAVQIQIDFVADGQPVTLFQNLYGVQVGRATLSLMAQSSDRASNDAYAAEAIPKLVDRMRAAGAGTAA